MKLAQRLHAAAFARVHAFLVTPYCMGADSTVDPASLAAVRQAKALDICHDFVSDVFEASPPPTFSRSGIYPGMKGSGVIRIDTIFVNRTAAACARELRLQYSWAIGKDHLPLATRFCLGLARERINVEVKPNYPVPLGGRSSNATS